MSVPSLLCAVAAAVVAATALPTPSERQPAMPTAAAEQLYTVLIYERPDDLTARTVPARADAYWTSYDDFAATLMRAGALRGGSALDERTTVTVRGTGSADRAVVGARLGGYFVIAAPSLAAAEGLVEVRPHRDNPHAANMPAKLPQ
jgi:hypothetical protein